MAQRLSDLLMPSTRSQTFWGGAKRAGTGDIGDMIEIVAAVLRASLRDKVADMYDRVSDETTDRLDAVTAQAATVLATKAPLSHSHPRGDITGLNTILNALDARVTALEARVTALETPPR